jgi:hypothetical protein
MRGIEVMQYSDEEERGYPWFFFHASQPWVRSTLLSLLILAACVGFFVWATRVSDDQGGDSFAGLVLAVVGTTFMIMAAVGFTLRRQARKRYVGQLNALLNWHVCFGVIALIVLTLHSFGNFNPRSGTYALYGMIALVICGAIGRLLDRMMPRMIAQQARKALTVQGEDRIESISRKLESIVVHNKQELRAFEPAPSGGRGRAPEASAQQGLLQDSWDMAFISLEETPQELRRDNSQYRFVPDQRSSLTRPGALYPGADEHMGAIKEAQHALRQESLFRYIIRFWRSFHIVLAMVTVGLTLWHIEYALVLVFPAIQKFGFGYLLPWP